MNDTTPALPSLPEILEAVKRQYGEAFKWIDKTQRFDFEKHPLIGQLIEAIEAQQAPSAYMHTPSGAVFDKVIACADPAAIVPLTPQSIASDRVALTAAFERECDDIDAVLRLIGLDPDACRTDGGSLNVGRAMSLLRERAGAVPAGFKLVPTLSTAAMNDAGMDALRARTKLWQRLKWSDFEAIYLAMLAASPECATAPSVHSTTVAQSQEHQQQSAHEAVGADGAPEERPVSNRCQSSDSPPDAARVLASSPVAECAAAAPEAAQMVGEPARIVNKFGHTLRPEIQRFMEGAVDRLAATSKPTDAAAPPTAVEGEREAFELPALVRSLRRASQYALTSESEAAILKAATMLEACEPFLKDDETPAERIERERRDTHAALNLLIAEKRKSEAAEAALAARPADKQG